MQNFLFQWTCYGPLIVLRFDIDFVLLPRYLTTCQAKENTTYIIGNHFIRVRNLHVEGQRT